MMWVHLPGIPSHLWSEKCFQEIGNFLGEYMTADMGFLDTGEMSMARILVSLNIKEGLREYINLTDLGWTSVKILDYEGVPFQCRRCHEYGHIVMDCKKSSQGHSSHHSFDVSRLIHERQEDNRGNSSSLVSNAVGTQSPTSTNLSISSTAGQHVPVGDTLALVPSLGDEACSYCSPETTPQKWIDNFLGTQLFIPRPVNGMLKYFNFLIRDCNPSFQNLPLYKIVSIKPHFTSSFLPFMSLVECSLCTDSPPESPASWSFKEPSFDGSKDSIICFHIQNRSISIPTIDSRGLGPTPKSLKTKKGRVRSSHISIAQSRALVGIASGRQRSILGALREVKSFIGAPP